MPRQKDASKSLTLDKRSKIMIGVLAVVLVAAAAYFLLLKKGSSSDNSASPSVRTPTTSTSPKASAAPKVTPKVSPSPVVTADSTRDPFVPLVQEAAATSSSNPAGTSSPAPSAAPSAAPTSSAPAAGSHNVALVTITGTTASVSYNNSSARSVKAGDTIATGITVTKISADSIFVNYNNKLYAIAPGQTVSF